MITVAVLMGCAFIVGFIAGRCWLPGKENHDYVRTDYREN